MTRALILMRHADAVATGSMRGDRDRPLTDGGLRDAAAVAARIDPPDVVVHSTAVRTSQTAHAMTKVWRAAGAEPIVAPEDELYAADPHRIVRIAGGYVTEHPAVLIVAHNPGISAAWATLTGDGHGMATASAAVLVCDADLDGNGAGGVAAMDWRLRVLVRPGGTA